MKQPKTEKAGPKPPKTMKPGLKIAHQIPGRIRMKIRAAKGRPELLEVYKQAFSMIPGIEQIDVSPETGSIVLKYDPDRQADFQAGFNAQLNKPEPENTRRRPPSNDLEILASKIEQEAEYLAEHSELARSVVDICKQTDRQIRTATNNMLDLKMMLAIGVVGITVFEVGATAATPVWVTLALFGLNHFIEMQAEQREAQGAAMQPVPVKA
ncbi:hypothetical protein SAMN02745126_01538 [Enhydrobacter aerosaccus]|uniref:Uncharacterized protein n=1 Tax=Enhydrobacter aerosaccus TaxID=225324 RepID=A0A1T4LGC5_9HYPH|nr:hypothetical protein [Enhydrobacter aerosaccus]SJZ53789.1 hypothetical protein SAMN02745126_01538 [Enhydrobacter aerosaccus]